ncbi:hypothetical protein [Polaromonas sp. DSR2-3-2]|uniref:hypothetical protein n=1 Tax=unclassified Polaromonas TaxID=2638319 RepID=UPI003CFAE837
MTHTTTHEKSPGTCDSKGLAADTTGTDFPTTANDGKAFANLAARFALAGHTLSRSNPADGAGLYFAARWGMSRALPDLQAAAHFLVQIGGGA